MCIFPAWGKIIKVFIVRKPLSVGSFLMERMIWSKILTPHTEWLPGVWLRASPVRCNIGDCEGWWLSSCRRSVVEYWLHKPGVLVLTPGDCRLFHFPLLHLKTSKIFLYVWCYLECWRTISMAFYYLQDWHQLYHQGGWLWPLWKYLHKELLQAEEE